MIKHFDEIHGLNIARPEGQKRFAYAVSEFEDFYDLSLMKDSCGYRGAVIRFYDFQTGKVFTPFEKERNVTYSKPLFHGGHFYFLQGDFNSRSIRLYEYFPEQVCRTVAVFDIDKTDLYNLSLLGEGMNVISQKDYFNCYYPTRISFPLAPNETAVAIREGKVFIEAWQEEGWDSEKDLASEEYRFYNKVIVKDFDGNTVSEETGSLFICEDGTLWIS
jgi:hypothetical protein